MAAFETSCKTVSLKVGHDTADALGNFSARIGVSQEDVMSVMVGLAEEEKRDRNGAVSLAGTMLECQELLEGCANIAGCPSGKRVGALLVEIGARLSAFEAELTRS